MKIKVQGGVIGGNGRGLCASCEEGSVREFSNNDIEVWCEAWQFTGSRPHRIKSPVTRCTAYKARGSVSKDALEKIAWHITTDKKTGKIGFLTPTERALQEKED